MQNREFENKVQEKMEELKLTPADVVWDKVEASLPKEKKRRWVIFILLFLGLMIGGLFVRNGLNKNAVNNTAKGSTQKNETNTLNIVPGKAVQNKKLNDTINGLATIKENAVKENNVHKNKKEFVNARTGIKIKKLREASLTNGNEEELVNTDPKKIITKSNTRIKVKRPAEIDPNETVIAKTGDVTTIADDDIAPMVLKRDSVNSIPGTAMVDSVTAVKKDTVIIASKENKKFKKNDRWHYGIELAGGVSGVKNNLFSNGPVYADVLASAFGSTPGGSPVSTDPNKPTGSIGLATGFYAEKNITPNWTFKTGLNYLYQSNSIKVGSKVDSSIDFSVDINKSLTASSYYRTGNSSSYKNKFHLIELPLIFRYQFPGYSRFYIEAGPSITYLLGSNALVYSQRTKAYVTDKDIFNKFGASINGGLVINFAQNKVLPFSIGYQFKYGIASVVRTSFGKQHFINSFLYLKIPLKK